MKIKLDENLDHRLATLLPGEHDIATVSGERLSGRSDEAVYAVCLAEQRILITLDLDFSNPLRFPPQPTQGIVVLRPPRPVLHMISSLLFSVLPVMQPDALRGRLWIVETGRIRIYEPNDV